VNQDRSQRLVGMAGVLFAAVLWGTTGTAATFAPEVGPLAVGAVAMGMGGLLQALIALRSIITERNKIAFNKRYLVIGAIAVAIYPLAFYASMRYAGVAVGTVISIGSAPLLSAVIEYSMDGQKLNKKWMLGAVIGVAGMTLLSFAEGKANQSSDGNMATLGIALGIIAGLTYALYSWSARRMMQKGVTTRSAMGATFGVGGLLLMPVLLITGSPLLASWNNASVGVYMAIVPMFIGYICYGVGLARIKASTATTITLIEPVVAALLAVLLVGEHLPAEGWAGIGLIILCLAVITIPASTFFPRQGVIQASDNL